MAMVARCRVGGSDQDSQPLLLGHSKAGGQPDASVIPRPGQELCGRRHDHGVSQEPRRRELVVLVEGVVERGGRFAEAVRIGERHGVEVFGVAKPGGEILRCRRQGNGAAGEIERLAVSASAPHRLRESGQAPDDQLAVIGVFGDAERPVRGVLTGDEVTSELEADAGLCQHERLSFRGEVGCLGQR